MHLELAQHLLNTARELDMDVADSDDETHSDTDVYLEPNYSGRAMFGKNTAGLVCSMRTFMDILFHTDPDDVEHLWDMDNLRSDNMGSDMIFY